MCVVVCLFIAFVIGFISISVTSNSICAKWFNINGLKNTAFQVYTSKPRWTSYCHIQHLCLSAVNSFSFVKSPPQSRGFTQWRRPFICLY